MVDEVAPNIYRIELPLPKNPLRALNSYLIKNGERNLIIDTGMNREECLDAMTSGLKEMKVDLNKTDFFITHMHADHSGLASTLATATSKVYASQADAEIINSWGISVFQEQANFATRNGFPEDDVQWAIKNHPGFKYSSKHYIPFSIVRDGDRVEAGDYSFRCVFTPGHTPGHMCLYDPDKKLFISGDHILFDITPNISLFYEKDNPLDEYLKSLDKVNQLEVKLALPGHRNSFTAFRQRIEELKVHHQTRANEVLSILQGGSQNAFTIASQMTWDMDYKFFHQFPVPQKWFAIGEALSHLKYLEVRGKVQREVHGQNVTYSLK